MNKIILLSVLVLIPLIVLMIVGSANYMGVCVPQMRILSDKEKIETAITLINEQKEIFSGVDKYCKIGRCKRIPYETVDQFLKENPDGCKVSKLDEQNANDPIRNFWNRIFGFYSGEVSCGYKVHFYDDAGERRNISIERTGDSSRIFITNCGKIFDW